MAGVHGLEHVERLSTSHLADHDAIGSHAQGVAYQVADLDLTPTLHIGGPALEADHVPLVELQLHRVLNCDNALVLGNEAREHVEKRGLAGTRSAANQDVELAFDYRAHQVGNPGRQGPEPDEIVHLKRILGEHPDRQHRPINGQRRNDGVHTGAIWKPGVDHGRGLVDAAAHLGHDSVDYPPQMLAGHETGLGFLDLAVTLDEDFLLGVDHDLRDTRVLEEHLHRSVTKNVLADLTGDLLALIV